MKLGQIFETMRVRLKYAIKEHSWGLKVPNSSTVLRAIHAPTGGEMLLDILEVAGGLALFALFAAASRFLPWWVDLATLAAGGAFAWWSVRFRYRLLLATAVLLSSFYFFLTQPVLIVVGWLAGGLALALIVEDIKAPSRETLAKVFALGTVISAAVMTLSSAVLLPRIYPITEASVTIAPAIWIVLSIILALLATLRQRVGEESHDWLVPPVMWGLFAVYFWPASSYTAMAVVCLVIALQTCTSYRHRQTYESKKLSHRGFLTTVAVGLLFLSVMGVSNRWQWLYEYQMGNAKNVKVIHQPHVSTVTRLVPRLAAPEYCISQNGVGLTRISHDPSLIAVQDGNQQKLMWECLGHPDRWLGNELLWLTGGVKGFVVVDAGYQGAKGHPVKQDFLFGDTSPITESAFYARHPGSVRQRAVIARAVDGSYALLIPYTSKVLDLGAMLPEAVGVMEVSNLGFIQDLTMAGAAAKYPGVPLYPSALARQYAELWGRSSSVFAMRDGTILEVSEGKKEENHYPYWETWDTGLLGVIPFETVGDNQTSLQAIGFIDPVSGDMEVYYLPEPETRDIAGAGVDDSGRAIGPKQIVKKVGLSHTGYLNVRTTEALLVVSPDHKIFWLTALIQNPLEDNQAGNGADGQKQKDPGEQNVYPNSILYTANGNDHRDVKSPEDVHRAIEEMEVREPKAVPQKQ
jgi:hypothetical protein